VKAAIEPPKAASNPTGSWRCPLCAHDGAAGLLPGGLVFEKERFAYRECSGCGSAACEPMPTEATLQRMYGPSYACDSGAFETEDEAAMVQILGWLGRRAPGVFVDFGCGSGALLSRVRAASWTSVGLEFDADVAARAAVRSGCRVFAQPSELRSSVPSIDVLHLGDVIEHLTAPLVQLQELIGWLRPGSWLLAQGPLEAGPCLFASVMRLAASARPRRMAHMPPYHVLRATVSGQKAFFDRLGLDTLAYTISEVAWPAPERFSISVLSDPRRVALFSLRKLSQMLSRVRPTRFGNRYFYVGCVRSP
jgi:trans-aconitate methyltransferase